MSYSDDYADRLADHCEATHEERNDGCPHCEYRASLKYCAHCDAEISDNPAWVPALMPMQIGCDHKSEDHDGLELVDGFGHALDTTGSNR